MYRALLVVLVVLLLPRAAGAERLPIRAYTTADGLAHNTVNRIVRDSRGFLWFATADGLSRFDGYGFTSFGVEHGLPHTKVTDLLETRSGDLWVATFGGLVRFRPHGTPSERVVREDEDEEGGPPPMFAVVLPADSDRRAQEITVLLEGRDGRIWCGTRKGLFSLDGTSGLQPVPVGLPQGYPEQEYITALAEDDDGTLWISGPSGLYRRWQDGTTAGFRVPELFGRSDPPEYDYVHHLMKDRRGGIWVASRLWGFFRLEAGGSRELPRVVEHHGYPQPFGSWVVQVLETSDGRLWATTNLGLVEVLPRAAADGPGLAAYNRSHGLTHEAVTALAEDAGGNLWIGSRSGAMKLAREGFVSYARQDGVAGGMRIFEDSAGALHVLAHVFRRGLPWGYPAVTRDDEHVAPAFGRFDGRAFRWFEPGPPFTWGWVPEGAVLRTRRGEWWLAGGSSLLRYPPLAAFEDLTTALPLRVFREEDGLSDVRGDAQVYRMFEDSREDVWFSLRSRANGLFRWNRSSDSLTNLSTAEGLPPLATDVPRAIGEDADGAIWIGLDSGVLRFRDGRFTRYTAADGLPPGAIVQIHRAADGRLWLASALGGLIRVDDIAAEPPAFTAYTTADGLSSNSIEVMTEDRYGRIYVGTGRGIDQFEPSTGRVRHFTTEDGLAAGWIIAAYRDRSGALWFGTHTGLSRFVPRAPEPSAPPAILVTGVAAGGQPLPISAVGTTRLAIGQLDPGGNHLQIEFASPRFRAGDWLRYQYRLEGADADWTPPTMRRSVTYARLSPGTYRFLVRAVNAEGVASPEPAVLEFVVLPPLWLQWWFLSAAGLALAAAALALHRYRLARTLELERVRTGIATDLHDDIGANLTRIAILSEVARRQRGPQADLDAPLSSIATIARESVASMGDIVWAINPERDTLRDMVGRMRDHAEEVFEFRDIRVHFDVPERTETLRLGANIRRDVYLVFKEAVNNAARHAGCAEVSIRLQSSGPELRLEVTDDGRGFDPAGSPDGNGLSNMRRRARRLGGALDVMSAPGAGTRVRLRISVRDSARYRWSTLPGEVGDRDGASA
jgi:signal transduction histidine kinase/ligand-binding sensor domain-containing protein